MLLLILSHGMTVAQKNMKPVKEPSNKFKTVE